MAWSEEAKQKKSEAMKAYWRDRKAAAEVEEQAVQNVLAAEPEGGKRKFDPPPKGEPQPKSASTPRVKRKGGKPSDAVLTQTIAKMFALPAAPAKLILHCDFCAVHFAREAGPTARELVALSAEHPALRGALEDMYRAYTSVTWVGIILGYIGKPLAHHLAPNHLLAATEGVMGVPPRDETPGPIHGMPVDLGSGESIADAIAQAQSMVENMSEEEARNLAAQLGLDVDSIPDAPTTPPDNGASSPFSEPAPVPGPHAGE